jgi:predicted ATPase/DNA-binding SARP family transcriptional activator
MLEINTFGGFTIKINGHLLMDLGSHKAEAVLLYLAAGHEICNRNTLATLLWPDSAQDMALTSLRVALSKLRRHLNDYIEISREAVRIKPGAEIYVDFKDLEMKLAIGQVDQALQIYRGDFLQGFHVKDCWEFEDWQRAQQERFHGLVIDALHAAVDEAMVKRDYNRGQIFGRRLLELDPLDELAHRKCMLLYAQQGDRARALALYKQCQTALITELGVEPSPQTGSLYNQISKGRLPLSEVSLLPPLFLPSPQTSFIDREAELAQIIALIGNPACRLLSLTGLGGIGKTRLAIRAATQCYKSFLDGTYFIPLETVVSPNHLVNAIANAIQFNIDTVATQLDAKYQLFDYLKSRSILLLMDGFEHLVTGAHLLSELLDNAPRVKVLLTTRQRLDLKGEWVFPVSGLPVPAEIDEDITVESGALKLFVERAHQANLQFDLSTDNCKPANQICKLVGGIPLGIELAASWTPLLPLEDIINEIRNSLDFLSSSWRDADPKHHSLRAAFDGSWELLSEEMQETFRKLCVFEGSFDRQAAMEVAGIEIGQLSNLRDRSLLYKDNVGRFSMHNLLRQYGLEKFQASPAALDDVQNRHCHYYIDYLTQRSKDLLGKNMFIEQDNVRREMSNIRKATDWAVLHWNDAKVRQILNGLLAFYCIQAWHEGMDHFNDIAQAKKAAALSQSNSTWLDDPVYLCATTHQAFLLCNLGQIDESDRLSRACLEPLRTLGIREELSECIHNLGVNASFQGKYEQAIEQLQEAIQLGHDTLHPFWPTYLLWLGHAYFLLGEYDRGLESLEKCYETFDRSENLWGMAFAMSKMGLAADGLGQFQQAKRYHSRALAIFEKTGNQAGKGYALSRMSMSAYFMEQYEEAVKLAEDGYQIFRSLGHHWGICTSLCRLGFAHIGLGETAKAGDCFTEALGQSRKYQMVPLSLYALAGMAATLVQRKDQADIATELFRYVRNQPQIPTIYVQQTARWFTHGHITPGSEKREPSIVVSDSQPLDEVVARILEREENQATQSVGDASP